MAEITKPVDELTFADLRYQFGTGRSFLISGTGRDKKFGYRNGVMTAVGDIEISKWKELMQAVILRFGEEELHTQLCEWEMENTPWPHTKAETLEYALELHSARIFDDPQWVDFIPFNRKYRPEVLEKANLIQIRYPCCGAVFERTKERFDRENGKEYCHTCKDWVSAEVLSSAKGTGDRTVSLQNL